MFTAYFTQDPPGYRAAPNPLADIGHIPPMHPDIRHHPTPLVQQRPPKKKQQEHDEHKPKDPEHKVDDYA